jgi:D-serine deaminase-like pyridoxal phosphate-dependent protein
MPRCVGDLRTPCLACLFPVLERNASAMRSRAEELGCVLRPHIKTVKTREAAELATGGTKKKVVVSTLSEAKFLVDAGFDDILYAYALTPDKLQDVAALTERCATFHVMVDHRAQAEALWAHPALSAAKRFSVFVGLDCGYHRDGVDPDDPDSIALVKELAASSKTSFAGLYTHAGHSYACRDAVGIRKVAADERDVTLRFAATLRAAELEVPCLGVGSTPTCSHPPADGLEGIDEMHPGNYLYYDVMQQGIGSCSADDIAARVLTRVIGHLPKANQLVVDCGWTGASAQGAEHGYGFFPLNPELRLTGFSQEVGRVSTADETPLDFGRYPIGCMLQLAPWHACAATHQHQAVHVLGGASSHLLGGTSSRLGRLVAAGQPSVWAEVSEQTAVRDTWRVCKGW